MDPREVRAAFDQQIRRNLTPERPSSRVEQDPGVIRHVSEVSGWNGVIWSDLGTAGDAAGPDAVISAQIDRFAEIGRPWEWKLYSYDQPPDLAARLVAAGLTRGDDEALMVAEIADLRLDADLPAGVSLRPVVDERGAAALVHVHDQVFGGDNSSIGRQVLAGMARHPSTAAAVVAYSANQPVSSGRVEFAPGTDFASIWGGGTLPAFRRKGLFRALVAHRAALAAERGFRYLQVDASPESRPILTRLGFVELATTTPFTHPGTRPAGGNAEHDFTGVEPVDRDGAHR